MEEKRRDRRDFLQNMIITLLSLSALMLTTQTHLYNLGSTFNRNYFTQLLNGTDPYAPVAVDQGARLSAPVHVAVTGAYGRYGDLTLTTTDEAFRPLAALLWEALGSSTPLSVCSAQDFQEALLHTSIYYDFLSPLPLAVLADIVGTSASTMTPIRSLLLSDTGSSVKLYLWDGEETWYTASAITTQEDLERVVNQYEFGKALFAFDRAETDPAYSTIEPLSLLPLELTPEFPILEAQNPLTETDTLLTSLRFNPRTNYRYLESNATEVIVEDERSLRICPDGTVLYLSGGEAVLTIEAESPSAPTVLEAAAGAGSLVKSLLPATGDAQLYLQGIRQSDSSTFLTFGYQVNGVPIRHSDGGYAAEVTLMDNVVTSLRLRFRQYTISSEPSLLLPLRQALAISASAEGAELSIGYADSAAATVSACWLAG